MIFYDNLKKLRELPPLELNQKQFGEAIMVTQKTVSVWENPEKNPANEHKKNKDAGRKSRPKKENTVSLAEIQTKKYIRKFFIDKLIAPRLKVINKLAFNIIPSETVMTWLVCDDDIFVPSESTYFHYMRNTAFLSLYLSDFNGLTGYSIKTDTLLNLAGRKIAEHPNKRFANRAALFSQSGQCESLAHVPVSVSISRKGQESKLAVLMLSLENSYEFVKMNGEVMLRVVRADEKRADKPIYSETEVAIAMHFAKAVKRMLLPILIQAELLSPDTGENLIKKDKADYKDDYDNFFENYKKYTDDKYEFDKDIIYKLIDLLDYPEFDKLLETRYKELHKKGCDVKWLEDRGFIFKKIKQYKNMQELLIPICK